jgi:predicted membrane protein involved in D-alanine export
MLFSSIPFLYTFLPCVLILYFLVPGWLKNTVLLLSSLFFYAWGEPRFVVFMVIAIVQGYVFGLLAEKFCDRPKQAKLCLWASAVVSLGLLGYCKYADFFIRSFNAVTGLSVPLLRVALPIGISFYTFQILSYVVDVHRGTVAAQRNLIDLGTYIAMFPQLIAGPIVRYADIEPQLKERRSTPAMVAAGAQRFVLGLGKKVLIANVLYQLITVYKATTQPSVLYSWMYAAAYMLHIYFDFSGYSDMAIGLGKIFGFTFAENFNYPYISRSVTEFWRRWHMSLGSWFRDYVYIPMGGNRVAPARRYLNILVVWMLTGLWHGADWNFVLWGLFFAVFLILEKVFLLKPLQRLPVLSHLYTLLLVAVSFVIFDSAGLSEAAAHLGRMFGAGGVPLATGETLYYLGSYAVTFIIAVIGATPYPTRWMNRLSEGPKTGRVLAVAAPVALMTLLAVVTAYLVDGSFNPFLYFRF